MPPAKIPQPDWEGLRDKLSILIVASPIRTHPATTIFDETFASLSSFLGVDSLLPQVDIIAVHDGPALTTSRTARNAFNEYLAAVEANYSSRATILVRRTRGGLTANIRTGLGQVKTPFVLVMQHDLPFSAPVDVFKVMEALETEKAIKHLRFNLRANSEPGWDAGCPPGMNMKAEIRAAFFQEHVVTPELLVMKTLGWSDNNHITRPCYYNNLVFPLVGRRKIAPEHALTPLVTPESHSIFGTFIWGGIANPAVIRHSDGRRYSQSWRAKIERSYPVARHAREKLRLFWWRISFRYSRGRFKILSVVRGKFQGTDR